MKPLSFCLVAGVALVVGACAKDTPAPDPDRAARIEAAIQAATETFCDKSWPAEGDGVRPFGAGPKVKGPRPEEKLGAWRWVNFWATWCAPCLEEMPLLGRWRDTLVREGLQLELELWSVDEDEDKLRARVQAGLPGKVVLADGQESLGEYLAGLELDPDVMLPVHMLVDPKGNLRCVRASSVEESDWGVVRRLFGRP